MPQHRQGRWLGRSAPARPSRSRPGLRTGPLKARPESLPVSSSTSAGARGATSRLCFRAASSGRPYGFGRSAAGALGRRNEAEALGRVEPLDGAAGHLSSLAFAIARPQRERGRAGKISRAGGSRSAAHIYSGAPNGPSGPGSAAGAVKARYAEVSSSAPQYAAPALRKQEKRPPRRHANRDAWVRAERAAFIRHSVLSNDQLNGPALPFGRDRS